MLQSDVLPNMGFSATRKRLMKSYECVQSDSTPELPFETEDKVEAQTDEGKQPAGNGQTVSHQSTGQEDASKSSSAGGESSGERQERDIEPESEGTGARADETKDEL